MRTDGSGPNLRHRTPWATWHDAGAAVWRSGAITVSGMPVLVAMRVRLAARRRYAVRDSRQGRALRSSQDRSLGKPAGSPDDRTRPDAALFGCQGAASRRKSAHLAGSTDSSASADRASTLTQGFCSAGHQADQEGTRHHQGSGPTRSLVRVIRLTPVTAVPISPCATPRSSAIWAVACHPDTVEAQWHRYLRNDGEKRRCSHFGRDTDHEDHGNTYGDQLGRSA